MATLWWRGWVGSYNFTKKKNERILEYVDGLKNILACYANKSDCFISCVKMGGGVYSTNFYFF